MPIVTAGFTASLESILTAKLEFIVTVRFNAGLKSVVTAELVICNAFSRVRTLLSSVSLSKYLAFTSIGVDSHRGID